MDGMQVTESILRQDGTQDSCPRTRVVAGGFHSTIAPCKRSFQGKAT